MKVASCAVPRVDKEKSVELVVIALCLRCVITDSVLRVVNSTNKVIELYISQKLHTHTKGAFTTEQCQLFNSDDIQ